MLRLTDLTLPLEHAEDALREAVLARLGLAEALALVGVIVSALSFCAFLLAMRRAPQPVR